MAAAATQPRRPPWSSSKARACQAAPLRPPRPSRPPPPRRRRRLRQRPRFQRLSWQQPRCRRRPALLLQPAAPWRILPQVPRLLCPPPRLPASHLLKGRLEWPLRAPPRQGPCRASATASRRWRLPPGAGAGGGGAWQTAGAAEGQARPPQSPRRWQCRGRCGQGRDELRRGLGRRRLSEAAARQRCWHVLAPTEAPQCWRCPHMAARPG
mmetsp:Transcript_21895/g.69281  ORF Transcript_21895/g.69281 Transcript_21895/m.69281 type:complete len:210 (-) Transcript_21895:62-691(-)